MIKRIRAITKISNTQNEIRAIIISPVDIKKLVDKY